MHRLRWAAAVVVATACAPGDPPETGRSASEGRSGGPLEQGRIYTSWLYQSQYQKLWDRFSPEMRQTFGSVTDLASFAGHAVQRLGAEHGSVDEHVANEKPYRVYTRTASFKRARDPVLIQWSLADDGQVTGLVVRPAAPAPSDSVP